MREPLAVLVAAAIAACTTRVERVPVETLDRTAPFVLLAAPAPSATGVPRNARVSVTFSEPMEPASLAGCLALEGPAGPVAGAVTASADGATVTFAPAALLEPLAGYAVTLAAGPRDRSGNAAAPARWAFRTAAVVDAQPPRIVARTPAPGDLVDPIETRTVSVTFDEPIDCAALPPQALALLDEGAPVPADVACAGATIAAFPADAGLPSRTSLVALASPLVSDLAGNALGAAESWSFRVRPWWLAGPTALVDPRGIVADRGGLVVVGARVDPLVASTPDRLDPMIVAYDPAGAVRFEPTLGTTARDEALAVARDPRGGFAIAGATAGALPGFPDVPGLDGLVASYRADGTLRWAEQMSSGVNDVVLLDVAVDRGGNVLLVGVEVAPPVGVDLRDRDGLIVKLDPAGVPVWRMTTDNGINDSCVSVDADALGSVVVSCYSLTASAGVDAVVAKMSGDLKSLGWATWFSTPDSDYVGAVAAAPSGDVFVAGQTTGNLGGPSAGNTDAFVARLDPGGRVVWIRQFGTPASDAATALVLDDAGVVVAGLASGWLDGGPPSPPSVFVAAFDLEGERRWLRQLPSATAVWGLAADGDGALYLAGIGAGPDGRPGADPSGWFIAKLGTDGRWR